MNAIQTLGAQAWVGRLGWTLVHFLWQGAVIAVLYAIARRWLGRSRSPQVRHLLACVALLALVIAPVVTFSLTGTPDSSASTAPAAAVHLSTGAVGGGPVSFTSLPVVALSGQGWQETAMPWLVIAWLAGAIIFWLRLAGGWVIASRMRSMLVRPAPSEWQRTLDELRARIRVSRPVRLLVSARVQVPTVVGWLRPVVLVPIGVLAGLPPEHVEALLTHELAHIRRQDYLVNILQNVAEALLFYHPAVWWVSNHIRNERELCCDDVAVTIGGDAFAYARALANLESSRPMHLNPAVAANGGLLPDRIGRLLGQSRRPSRTLPGPGVVLGALLILGTTYGLFGQAPAAKPEFEVASVKPSERGVPRGLSMRGGPGTDDPGRVTIENFPLESLILTAYDLKTYQLTGGPDWLMGNFGPTAAKFDIAAKVPAGATKEEFLQMLQNLLVERFKLTLHHEQKEMPVFELVVAKNGPKFKPSPLKPAADDVSPNAGSKVTIGGDGFPVLPPGVSMAWVKDRARMRVTKESMDQFVGKLSVQMDRPVRNGMGLKGEYDFELFWLPDSVAAADMNAGPTLTQAVQDQLGLRLEAKKAPVAILVIDHIEKTPTEN